MTSGRSSESFYQHTVACVWGLCINRLAISAIIQPDKLFVMALFRDYEGHAKDSTWAYTSSKCLECSTT